jgi:hypothetical protein
VKKTNAKTESTSALEIEFRVEGDNKEGRSYRWGAVTIEPGRIEVPERWIAFLRVRLDGRALEAERLEAPYLNSHVENRLPEDRELEIIGDVKIGRPDASAPRGSSAATELRAEVEAIAAAFPKVARARVVECLASDDRVLFWVEIRGAGSGRTKTTGEKNETADRRVRKTLEVARRLLAAGVASTKEVSRGR